MKAKTVGLDGFYKDQVMEMLGKLKHAIERHPESRRAPYVVRLPRTQDGWIDFKPSGLTKDFVGCGMNPETAAAEALKKAGIFRIVRQPHAFCPPLAKLNSKTTTRQPRQMH